MAGLGVEQVVIALALPIKVLLVIAGGRNRREPEVLYCYVLLWRARVLDPKEPRPPVRFFAPIANIAPGLDHPSLHP